MSPSSAASSAGTWRTLVPVFAACAAIGLQAGVAMPLVPLALEREGADKFTIGVVSAAWAVGMLAFGTRIPALAARLGAARAIVLAVVIGSAITLAYTVTSGPLAWGILSFLHGVVGGIPWVVSEIWMNVVVEEKRRGRVMAIYAIMVALGMALFFLTPADVVSDWVLVADFLRQAQFGFAAFTLAVLALSAVIQVISPDDLFLYAKAGGSLLAAGLNRPQELIGTLLFGLATTILLLIPLAALLLLGQDKLQPWLLGGKQWLFSRADTLVAIVSLALAVYLGAQGVEGLRLA